MRSFKPDVLLMINCHRNAMLWGGLCAQFGYVGSRVIAVHHAGTLDNEKNFHGVDMLFLPSTDTIIALSDWHAQYLLHTDKIDPSRITIIPNGILVEEFSSVAPGSRRVVREELGVGPGDPVVIMVAGLREGKEHDVLIRAASHLVRERPTLKVVIAGDGPTRPRLEQLASSLKMSEHVLFIGERHDVPELLHASDILVLASVAEAMPLSVIEAMAAGTPVVASAVGSVPDIIEDGVNGVLVPPSNTERLAEALARILDDPAAANQMVEHARNSVLENFTLDRMVNDYERLFERLTNRARQ
jgi:glycosyltransferase involved in cell wall biosynthesis